MILNTLASLSLVGIWPRFIEPAWLEVTKFDYSLPQLKKDKLTLLHISDLHFSDKPSLALQKAARLVTKLKPDCIVCTGDFLCYSQLRSPAALEAYLSAFKAPYGSFAVLGNHDYSSYVSFGAKGTSVILDKSLSLLSRFQPHPVPDNLPGNPELMTLLKRTPFQLLQNETIQTPYFNITGLGDFFARDVHPERGFAQNDPSLPNITLCHNPITAKDLGEYPSDLILAGHTHGSQFNIPLIRNLLLQDPSLRRGLIDVNGKKLFISRGLGSHIHFRLFSRPEITLITLHGKL